MDLMVYKINYYYYYRVLFKHIIVPLTVRSISVTVIVDAEMAPKLNDEQNYKII